MESKDQNSKDLEMELEMANSKIEELNNNVEQLRQALLIKTTQYQNAVNLINKLSGMLIDNGVEQFLSE